jgi:hypothetical protein
MYGQDVKEVFSDNLSDVEKKIVTQAWHEMYIHGKETMIEELSNYMRAKAAKRFFDQTARFLVFNPDESKQAIIEKFSDFWRHLGYDKISDGLDVRLHEIEALKEYEPIEDEEVMEEIYFDIPEESPVTLRSIAKYITAILKQSNHPLINKVMFNFDLREEGLSKKEISEIEKSIFILRKEKPSIVKRLEKIMPGRSEKIIDRAHVLLLFTGYNQSELEEFVDLFDEIGQKEMSNALKIRLKQSTEEDSTEEDFNIPYATSPARHAIEDSPQTLVSSAKLIRFAGTFEKFAHRPRITFAPGNSEMTAAIDIAMLYNSSIFKVPKKGDGPDVVTDILLTPGSHAGFVSSDKPGIIHVNLNSIMQQSDSRVSAALAAAGTLVHEAAHVHDFVDGEFPGGEAVAESSEAQFKAWVNGNIDRIRELPSVKALM